MIKPLKNIFVIVLNTLIFIFYLTIISVALTINHFLIPKGIVKKKINYFCRRFAYHLVVSIFSHWFPNPFFIKYNEKVLNSKKTIIISNHCSDFDWLFLFVTLYELKKYDTFHLLLKKSIGDIPLLGYGLRKFGHIMLNRKKSKDIKIIQDGVQTLVEEQKCDIMLYPEGTYLYPEALKSAKEFAKDRNIQIEGKEFNPERVLVPKKTGFNLIRDILKEDYDGVVDMTIIMNPYILMPSVECSPSEFLIKQEKIINQFYLIDFIPKEDISEEFLLSSFKKKQDVIEKFTKNTSGLINKKKKFVDIIRSIGEYNSNSSIKMLYITSKYKVMIFTIPICLASFILLKIF